MSDRPAYLFLPPSGRTVSEYRLVNNTAQQLLPGEPAEPIETPATVVIIGANGSGKSRLGGWIELDGPQQALVRRISAQKSLVLPSQVSPKSLDFERASFLLSAATEDEVRTFRENPSAARNSIRGRRWGRNPTTHLLNDFSGLMQMLFAEYQDVTARYFEESERAKRKIPVPDTLLSRLKRVWHEVLPHRELHPRGGKIEVGVPGTDPTYNAAEMSDGERVAFYHIGQAIAADSGSILIIDEPETHLHRAIQASLWDAIERERPDCLFVYLTHDLEFAASRADAVKIWLKGFDGANWEWEVVPQLATVPEDVLLAILGSRKPVLFVEGEQGGGDYALYSRIYPGWTIIARETAAHVISATRSLPAVHPGLTYAGIVDRDFRSDEEIASLATLGVHVLNVHELENLFLEEGVLRAAVAEALSGLASDKPVEDVVTEIKAFVLEELAKSRHRLASTFAAWRARRAFLGFDMKAQGLDALVQAVEAASPTAAVRKAFVEAESLIERILREGDYQAALRILDHKGLVKKVDRFIGLSPGDYPSFVRRLITHDRGEPVLNALRASAPNLKT